MRIDSKIRGMNFKEFSVSCFFGASLLLISTGAQAQKPLSSMELTDALRQAETELIVVTDEIAKMSQVNSGYSACAAYKLLVRQAYADWFVKSGGKRRDLLNQLLPEITGKMRDIGTTTVKTLPVVSQRSEEIIITFDTLKTYMNDLNLRLSTCAPNERDDVLVQQENPILNRLHLTHSQIKEAAKILTDKLNTSLKESGNSYKVAVVNNSYRMDLVLSGETAISDSESFKIEVSLLNPVQTLKIFNVQKSSADYSSNAYLRYLQMYRRIVSDTCKEASWKDMKDSDFDRDSNLPLYVTYENAVRRFEETSKNRFPNPGCPFIESDYIKMHPDVATAVQDYKTMAKDDKKNGFKNGLDHYERAGRREGRAFNRTCGPKKY